MIPPCPLLDFQRLNCGTPQFSTGQLSTKARPKYCVNKWAYFDCFGGSLKTTLNFRSSCWDERHSPARQLLFGAGDQIQGFTLARQALYPGPKLLFLLIQRFGSHHLAVVLKPSRLAFSLVAILPGDQPHGTEFTLAVNKKAISGLPSPVCVSSGCGLLTPDAAPGACPPPSPCIRN